MRQWNMGMAGVGVLAKPLPPNYQPLQLCGRYGLGEIESFTLTDDGQRILIGGWDLVRGFHRLDGSLSGEYPTRTRIGSIVELPDAQPLVVGTVVGLSLFGSDGGLQELPRPSENISIPIAALPVPHTNLLLVSNDSVVQLLQAPTFEPLAELELDLTHSHDRVAVAADGRFAWLRGRQGLHRLELSTQQLSTPLPSAPNNFWGAVATGPGGLAAFSGGTDSVRLFQGEVEIPLSGLGEAAVDVDSLDISADGTLLAAMGKLRSSISNQVDIWQIPSGVHNRVIEFHGRPGNTVVRFDRTGERVFATAGTAVRGFDLQSGDEVEHYAWGYEGLLRDYAFSASSHLLATAADDGLMIWDLALDRDARLFMLNTHEFTHAVVFSADGQRLYSWGDSLDEWDPRTGQKLRSSDALDGAGSVQFAISPDGTKLLAHVGGMGHVMLSTETLKPLFSTQLAERATGKPAFSPDGTHYVGAYGEGELASFSAEDGHVLARAQVERGTVPSMWFALDGSRVLRQNGRFLQVFRAPGLEPLYTIERQSWTFPMVIPSDNPRYVFVHQYWRDEPLLLVDIASGEVVSSGTFEAEGVPRIQVPSGEAVSMLIEAPGGLRLYCAGSEAPVDVLSPD